MAIIIDGITVKEMQGSGTIAYTESDVTGTRILRCDWTDRTDLVRALLGFSILNASDGTNEVTASKSFNSDRDPALFAVSAVSAPLVANALEDVDNEISYEFAIVTVTYKPRQAPEDQGRDEKGTVIEPEDPESNLVLTTSINFSIETITIPDASKNWSFRKSGGVGYGTIPDGAIPNGSMTKIVPYLEWTLDYKKIPDPLNINAIRKGLGKIHSKDGKTLQFDDGFFTNLLDVRGLGKVRKGTMLFLGASASQDTVLLQGAGQPSKKAWRLRLRFKEHSFSWNYIYRGIIDTGAPSGSLPRFGWWPVLTPQKTLSGNEVGNKTLYDVVDFNTFMPDIKGKITS